MECSAIRGSVTFVPGFRGSCHRATQAACERTRLTVVLSRSIGRGMRNHTMSRSMKSLRAIALVLTCAAMSLSSVATAAPVRPVRPARSTQRGHAPVLRHVVLFAFKATATPADIARLEAAFAALPNHSLLD